MSVADALGDRETGFTRRALVVAGMHRSGTSAVSRIVNLLGADLPRQLIPPNPTNRSGHWEPIQIANAHDALFASIGISWDDPSRIPAERFPTSDAAAF